MHPRSVLIHFDDFRSKFDGVIIQGRLYEVRRGGILADDISVTVAIRNPDEVRIAFSGPRIVEN